MRSVPWRHTTIASCLAVLLGGCGNVLFPFNTLIDDDAPPSAHEAETPSTAPVVEPTATYAIALGGVAPGRDELLLSATGTNVSFSIDDATVIGLLPRPTFASFTAGNGAQIVPQKTGKTVVRYRLDTVEQPDIFHVTVPPQELIQVLIGEARGLLKKEATVKEGVVQLGSISPTGDAIAAVIRNRLALIDTVHDPALFVADPLAYYLGPPSSSYAAVIEAVHGNVYQFSPVDPSDPSHDEYTNAAARSFLDPTLQLAYDQAVLTAAAIFDGRTEDPTGGAFAFRSPTGDEAACLAEALNEHPAEIPVECGPGDANFPALAPVQMVILPTIGTQSDGRPAFIFYRTRQNGADAIVDTP